MPSYWLDANVFIEPKNQLYAFDIVPGYWEWIIDKATEGIIRSPMAVYDEILKWHDAEEELIVWVKKHKDTLFVDADDPVQMQCGIVGEHVVQSADDANAAEFLRGADPWLVSHAICDSGVVVTIEKRKNTKAVKIPNVCEHFQVECITLRELLRKLGASFVDGSKKKG